MLEEKASSGRLLSMAKRARLIAAQADYGVANLFIHHAEMCERAAMRPIGRGDHHAFDEHGRLHPLNRSPDGS